MNATLRTAGARKAISKRVQCLYCKQYVWSDEAEFFDGEETLQDVQWWVCEACAAHEKEELQLCWEKLKATLFKP